MLEWHYRSKMASQYRLPMRKACSYSITSVFPANLISSQAVVVGYKIEFGMSSVILLQIPNRFQTRCRAQRSDITSASLS